jgi:hypothetical protein
MLILSKISTPTNLKKQPLFLKMNDLCLKMNLKRT